MAYTKTIEDADEYFAIDNHMAGPLWEKYNKDEKAAAFASARRVIERERGADLVDPIEGSDNDDLRDDYAHFEQTLWMLLHSPYRADSTNTGVSFDVGDEEASSKAMNTICDEASKWLWWEESQTFRG